MASDSIHADILAAEIGSTTTVVSAFAGINTKNPVLLGQGQAATTAVSSDVLVGLQAAVDDLKTRLNTVNLDYDTMIATSSAAGGLKMTVHGLVPDMTARAAKEAALGAGAVVKLVTGDRLTDSHLKNITEISPNIILLAGGLDQGERETAVYNARFIRGLGLSAPVVYGGNTDCRAEIESIFRDGQQRLYIVDNVYPRIDELCVESAQRVIQSVFEEHIVHAPGMAHIKDMVDGGIMPTPGAVMEAAKTLYGEIGDLAVVDIGGATTDIHSVTAGSPENAGKAISPEPFAKRTVEGDLGVYVNAGNVLDAVGVSAANAALGFDAAKTLAGYNGVPGTKQEIELVSYLALYASRTALYRHAGRKRHMYGPTGRVTVTEGKDLTMVRCIIGTGGVLTRLRTARNILYDALSNPGPVGTAFPLLPKIDNCIPAFVTDSDYIMAVSGVLTRHDKTAAITLLLRSLGIESKLSS